MADVFDFCGKISLGKETEKFKPVEKKEFQSGWVNHTVKFNVISGNNRILCMAQGGKWINDSKNSIKTYSKSTTDENGKTIRGSAIEIPWSKRFDESEIDRVAGFRRYVVDTGDYKKRYKLQDLVAAFENGSVTEEMKTQVGIYSLEDAKAALDRSKAKRKVFISEWDFVDYVVKMLQSETIKDKMFNVSGSYEVQYSPGKGRFYTNYHVDRITLAPDDAEPVTDMKINFYYGENAWDDSSYDESGKCYVRGWVSYYDGMFKKNGFKDIVVVVKEDNEKKRNALKRKFSCDDGIKQIGLTLQVMDGAETIELTMDMLDEETRDDIECGLLSWEEVKRDLGGRAIGDRVSELRFKELTPRKNVAQDTVYAREDMTPATNEMVNDDFDLFADDDI